MVDCKITEKKINDKCNNVIDLYFENEYLQCSVECLISIIREKVIGTKKCSNIYEPKLQIVVM